jgi:hypothetical protein
MNEIGSPTHTVMSCGHAVRTGGVVSLVAMVWLHCAVLPQASVALQVRVATNVLPQPALVVVPTMVIAFVPQVSLAVGAVKSIAVPHSLVTLAEQVITGGVVSIVAIVWLQFADVLPQASVARQVRVATNVLPQVALVVVLTMLIVFVPHVSLAVGAVKLIAVPH